METSSKLPVISPSTGRLVREHQALDVFEVNRRIEAAHGAFQEWRDTSFEHRSQVLLAASKQLLDQQDRYAARITAEMGKPLTQSQAEVEKCAWVCRFYADNAQSMLAPQKIQLDESEASLVACPLGVIYAIMPWNFPFWQAFRAAAPALMAGNGMLLKGAANVPGCSADVSEIFSNSGIPCGLFTDLPIDLSLSSGIIANPLVRGVTLTGSEAAGRAVAAEAGANLKKCLLELGGNDPYIVLEDANLALAVQRCVASRMLCAGQVCIAAKRLIVVEQIYDRFRELLMKRILDYVMLDPFNVDSPLGPLARRDLRDKVHSQVQASVKAGALLLTGGEVPDCEGWWYPATVLDNVQPGMAAFDDEVFGPVIALIRAKDTQHALELASHSRFGLGGAIFSEDVDQALRLASEKIDVGCIAVNDFVRSDPRVPFGGTKDSGFGRELGSIGIREFVNLKSIVFTLD